MHVRIGRIGAIGAALLVSVGALVGCGDDGDDSAKTNSQKPVNVAFITWAYTDYAQAEERGIKKALQENGGSVKVFNANFDPQLMQKQCQDAITSGRYNAIALSPVTPPTGVPCVKAAKAANIPVATIEQTVGTDPARTYDTKPQVDGVVAVNTLTLGEQVKASSALVREACEGHDPCKAIYEAISPSDPYSKNLIEGIKKTVPSVDVVHEFVSGVDPAAVVKAIPDILAANPDANVYISAADSSGIAAMPAIKAAGMQDKLAVLGNGGSRQGAAAIAAGTMFGTVGNWPTQNGEFITRALIQAVNGEEVTDVGIDGLLIDTPLLLTKATVGDFKPEW